MAIATSRRGASRRRTNLMSRARDVSVGAVVGPPGGVIGRIWPAVIVVVPIVSEPGPDPTEATAVTIMPALATITAAPQGIAITATADVDATKTAQATVT